MTILYPQSPDVIFFDFSGVLAEEGFVEGLKEVGRRNGKDPQEFLHTVSEICWNSGYVNGTVPESYFWQSVRDTTGIQETDENLRDALLSRFIIRLWMLDVADRVRASGVRSAILSDHTNWLEELDEAHGIYRHFDRVFNSYREGLNKRQLEYFHHACKGMDISPDQALFIDDNPANIKRAASVGMQTIHYTSYDDFAYELSTRMPSLILPPASLE